MAQDAKAVVREFVAAADALDFDRARTYLSPALQVHLPGMPGPLDLATYFQFGQAWHHAFPDEET